MYSDSTYQCKSPSVEQVRKDVLSILTDTKIENLTEEESQKLIQKTVLTIIPKNRNNFGSYKGYITFGVGKEIAQEVINSIKKQLG